MRIGNNLYLTTEPCCNFLLEQSELSMNLGETLDRFCVFMLSKLLARDLI